MRVRANINVHKPLKRGETNLSGRKNEDSGFIQVRRIPDFCYVCGKVAHNEIDCNVVVNM